MYGLKVKIFNELFQASGILFLASIFVNLCNLFFWLFMVRNLVPEEYALLNALFSLTMILSLPATTVQTVVAKAVSKEFFQKKYAAIKYFLVHFGKRVLFCDLLFLLLFALSSPVIGNFLKSNSIVPVLITGGFIFFTVIGPLVTGALQGSQRFLAMAISNSVYGLLKLGLGGVLVFLGFRAVGALLGLCLAALAGFGFSLFLLPDELTGSAGEGGEKIRMKSVYQYTVPVFLSLLGWMVLTNVDVIMVKHFFSAQEAGWYSVAQMTGKVVLFLPAVVGVILFPKMSEAHHQGKTALAYLKTGLFITGFLSAAAGVFCMLFPMFALRVLTGSRLPQAVSLVPFFCVAMIFYALVNQLMFYNLAIHRFTYTAYLVSAAVIQVGLIASFHSTLNMVLYSLVLVSMILFGIGVFEAVGSLRR
ncbi:MAG: oligosaccharide flippase family protein [Candidatus Omnitrophota bacterium]